jgi:DNA polymerase III subunit delta
MHGEEPFFIDQLASYIETHALDEASREFNQSVLYGRDVTPEAVISMARSFPMMGNYQVVILKEAQEMDKIDELEAYIKSPLSTTVLVICYKHKKVDKRKSFYKSLSNSKDTVLFHSERLKDYQIPDWIEKTAGIMGYSVNPVSSRILSDYLGNDLGKIHNELEKLAINLEKGATITEEEIEQHIGISKDFNIFELQKALGTRNALKVQRIVKYFEDNPKEHPLQMLSVILHNFFVKVFIYHHVKQGKPKEIASELGVPPFFVKDYAQAAKVYSPQKIKTIISGIRTLDLKSKGVGTTDATSYGELKQLMYTIMH